MRKILLASTALVAMTSVSAMAADITISGGFEVGYNSEADQADGTNISSETDWNINFSHTTDSGITTALNYGFDESGGVDDQNYSISGDFGTLAVANSADGDDSAVDGLDIEAGTVDENTTFVSHTSNYGSNYDGSWSTRIGSTARGTSTTGDSLSYTLPSIVDGLTVAISHQNETGLESTAYGATFDIGPATIAAAKMTGAVDPIAAQGAADGRLGRLAQEHVDIEGSHMGVSLNIGGIVAEYAVNKYETTTGATGAAAGTASEGEGTRMGLSYAMGDLTLGYETVAAKWDNAARDAQLDTYKYDSVGASYAVAEGITAKLAITDAEIQNDDTETEMDDYSTTRVSVSVAF